MILIFVEDSYLRSIWCQNLVDGLVAELKLKRIAFRFITSLDELVPADPFVYVIGSSSTWVRTALETISRKGLYPILLCNQAFHELDMTYSTVCSDIRGSMQHLVDILLSAGRSRIALYGVNPRSISDESRRKGFCAATGLTVNEDIYINDGSLADCFCSFRDKIKDYDAVICANDFAAISLVRNLLRSDPKELERLLIIGCAETRLTEFYSRYVLSIRVNFPEYGRAAVMLMESLKRNPYLSDVVMTIRWDFSPLSSLERLITAPTQTPLPVIPESKDIFYQDEELNRMLCIERLLNECDALDREMLKALLRGEPYEVISERCFVTVSTVKYRIKKMISTSQTSNRAELIDLLQEFLPNGLEEL